MEETKSEDILHMDSKIAEIEREKETLAQQVKRLIQAESKLYEFQEELDAQLKEYKDLYHLNRKLTASLDMNQIPAAAVEYVIQNLNYERALFLQLAEDTGTYHVCALDGYYDDKERNQVAELAIQQDAPFLVPLMAGKEYLFCGADPEPGQEREYRARLRMEEYFVYPLGGHPRPQALLAAGNTARHTEFYRKVSASNGTLVSMGNFTGLISSLIESYVSYHKLEELSELLEQRVKETVNEARQKDKILILQGRQAVMGEMISNIAHQWRQPLNMLGLLAQDLQMTKELGDLSKEYVDCNVNKTMNIIHQMSKTIDDFRNFFKPDKEKVLFKARESIEKTLSMLEGSFKSLEIRTEVRQSGDPVISGYPGEFTQVMLNILINARDALVSHKVARPTITITINSNGDRTVVKIIDNAGGISDEIIDRIFEPYFTTKGPEQGTGIGLFMCKNIIEKNMEGVLSARNVEEGAEFMIELQNAERRKQPR